VLIGTSRRHLFRHAIFFLWLFVISDQRGDDIAAMTLVPSPFVRSSQLRENDPTPATGR
jgi:hypothetical protein